MDNRSQPARNTAQAPGDGFSDGSSVSRASPQTSDTETGAGGAVKLTKAQAGLSRDNPDVKRLLAKTRANGDCWDWTGVTTAKGYGHIFFRGKARRAHRVSYTLFCGEIPDDLLVCHHCDRPRCVNPKHLFLGHRTTNTQDMIRKGRGKAQITSRQDHFRAGHAPRGQNAVSAKLAAAQVEALLQKAADGALSIDLALEYGISRFSVQAILRGETYREIPRPAGLPRKTGSYVRRLALQSARSSHER